MADHFVFVKLIVQENADKKALETPGGAEMKSAMGGEKAGLPFYFFLDKDGKKIGDSLNRKFFTGREILPFSMRKVPSRVRPV